MSKEMKEWGVILFKADKTKDSSPDYTGKVMVGSNLMRIALWEKTGEKGTYFSGKISEFLTGGSDFKKDSNYKDDRPF